MMGGSRSIEEGQEPSQPFQRYHITESPPARKLVPLVVALSLAVFCQALDQTIIATAIPRITNEFNSLEDLGWYGSSYLLATCAFQLSYGKLYNLFRPKWVFLASIAMFELGSLVLGVTPTSIGFIMGRVIAGIGAGGIFSGALLLIAASVPLDKRSIYTGLFGSMYAVASVAGPLLGGAFTERVTWRLCFLINLPCGLLTAIFVFFFFAPPQTESQAVQSQFSLKDKALDLDLLGLAVFIPMIVCLLLALQWGGTLYSWDNARIIVLFVLTGALLLLFIATQWYQKNRAMIPPGFLRDRTVISCSIFVFFLYGAFVVISYYLPIWFQAIKGVSPLQSGIDTLPLMLGTVVSSMIGGGLVSWVGTYTWACILSSALTAVGAGLLVTLKPTTGSPHWIGYQVLVGLGLGLGVRIPEIAVQVALPDAQISEGIALMAFTQILGAAVFVQVGQNIFTNRLVQEVKNTGIPVNVRQFLDQGITKIADLVPDEYRHGVILAYNKAIIQTFYLAVGLAALSVVGAALIPWLSVKTDKTKGQDVSTDNYSGAVRPEQVGAFAKVEEGSGTGVE